MKFSVAFLLASSKLLASGLTVPNHKRDGEDSGAIKLNNSVAYLSCTLSYSAYEAVAAIPGGTKFFSPIKACVALGVPFPSNLKALQLTEAQFQLEPEEINTSSTITDETFTSVMQNDDTPSSTSTDSVISFTINSVSLKHSPTFAPYTQASASRITLAIKSSSTPLPRVVITSCVAGTYSSTGYSPCLKCAAGSISTGAALSCSACLAGTYVSSDATSCINCSAGSFSAGSALNCSFCSAGTESSPAASICTNCLPGKFTLGNGDICRDCTIAIGAFSCDAKTGSVATCSAGYGIASGSKVCSPCLAGTASARNATTCSTCSGDSWAGYKSPFCSNCTLPFDGSQVNSACNITTGLPTHCSPGYGIAPYSTKCTPCAAGTVQLGGGTICSVCSGGSSWSGLKSSVCTNCTLPHDGSQVNSTCNVTSGAPTFCSIGFGLSGQKCVACTPGSQYQLGNVCTACNLVGNQDLTCDNYNKVNGCHQNFGLGLHSSKNSSTCSACVNNFYSANGTKSCEPPYNIVVTDVTGTIIIGYLPKNYSDSIGIYNVDNLTNAVSVAPPRSFLAKDMPVTLQTIDSASPFPSIGFAWDYYATDIFASNTNSVGWISQSADNEVSEYFNQPCDIHSGLLGKYESLCESNIFNIAPADSQGRHQLHLTIIDGTKKAVNVSYIFYNIDSGILGATSDASFANNNYNTQALFFLVQVK